MILKNSYWYFLKALTENQCNDIILAGLNRFELTKQIEGEDSIKASTANLKHKQGHKDSNIVLGADKTVEDLRKEGVKPEQIINRDAEVSWLNDQWIYDLILPFIYRANKNADWNFDIDYAESMQFTIYKPGMFYTWHADQGDRPWAMFNEKTMQVPNIPGVKLPPNTTLEPKMVGKIRKISMTLNLTSPENYDGGNLKFDYGPHTADERFHTCTEARAKGSMIVFPSFQYHQVTPVTRGTRYSLVLWCNGKPYR